MLHLTSKVTGSGEAERNWKDTKYVYTKARNRLAPVKREKLITRYNVLAQRYGLLNPDQVDPAAELAKYGDIRKELEDPEGEICAARDNCDDEVRENVFKPYFEIGETARLGTKECDDCTARYWLLQKYKGMVFLDEDVEPAEYRKIVDLEWNVKRPKGWKMPGVPVSSHPWRQWKVVGDLLPEKHQAMIDQLASVAIDADDENPTLEAYFINLELFKMIKAAPAELQVRKIDLRAGDAMDEDSGSDDVDGDDDDDDGDDDESSRRR